MMASTSETQTLSLGVLPPRAVLSVFYRASYACVLSSVKSAGVVVFNTFCGIYSMCLSVKCSPSTSVYVPLVTHFLASRRHGVILQSLLRHIHERYSWS